MTNLTEDRIRALALALSQDPARAACSDVDNWLEAERRLAAGLAEAPAEFEPAAATARADDDAGESAPKPVTARLP